METLAFYSYKGGVGRSALLASAAHFLASRGKGVVALDFDFEAPGLHYKLGHSFSGEGEPEQKGGAVPYLVTAAEETTAPPPFTEHMLEIPVPSGAGGWLRLMPAGPAPHRGYWAALKKLGEQVRFDDPSGKGLMLLFDLHARIEEELKPDYLLIDARTGVTELGALATTILADTVVCLFVTGGESLDGTLTVVGAMRAAPRLERQRQIRIVPVLRPHVWTIQMSRQDTFLASDLPRVAELFQGDEPPLALPFSNSVSFSPPDKATLELFQRLFLIPY